MFISFLKPCGERLCFEVYQEDNQDHHLEFIGEDSISHTPKNEKVSLCMGEAFDIRFDGYKMNSRKDGRYEYIDYRFEVRNHKDELALIKIPHFMPDMWEMVKASEHYEKESADNIVFWTTVDANTNKVIDFTYRVDRGIDIELKDMKF